MSAHSSRAPLWFFDAITRRGVLRRDVLAALITGQIAGLAMAVMLTTAFTFSPAGHWYSMPQLVASTLLGESALGSFSTLAFVLGVLMHQAISLLWSLVFVWVFNQVAPSWLTALVVGVGLGILALLVGAEAVVPWSMFWLHGRDLWAENVPLAWSALAHLVFGGSFVLFVPISAELELREADADSAPRRSNPSVSP